MVKRREVLTYFEAHGFVNQGGARHDRLSHPDGRTTTLKRHREISNIMFETMKKQAKLR